MRHAPSTSAASNASKSSSQIKCSTCRKPGYLEEPYHLPGYTGHIPTMRYRHGGSFGRTSRNIFEDPCVPLAPIPVLVPIYDPKNPANSFFNQRTRPNTNSDVFQSQCQKMQKYPLRNTNPPPRIEANRPKTASCLSEEHTEKSREFKACRPNWALQAEPTSQVSNNSHTNSNPKNKCSKNSNNGAYEVEIFQLPCWPGSDTTQDSNKERNIYASKNKNTEIQQRPVTASCDTAYTQKTLNSDLTKLIQQAFPQAPESIQAQHCSKPRSNSRSPSRVSSQMSLLNRNQTSREEDFYSNSKLNIKETLPTRPQTSYEIPNSYMSLQDSTDTNGCDRSCAIPWKVEIENPMRQEGDIRCGWNFDSFPADPKPADPLNTELSGAERWSEGTEFVAENLKATARNARGVNRSPFARMDESYGSCCHDIDTNIYRLSEALQPSYTGHVPGYAFSSDGRTYGQATCGTKKYLDKCMMFNKNNDN